MQHKALGWAVNSGSGQYRYRRGACPGVSDRDRCPVRLAAAGSSLQDVTDALVKSNVVTAAGMLEENYHLYLTSVDGRIHSEGDIANSAVVSKAGHPFRIRDFGRVQRAPEPSFTVVTAEGRNAVLLNLLSQPEGSAPWESPPPLKSSSISFGPNCRRIRKPYLFYDQSSFVREAVGSVWEAIFFGLILSIVILYLFLKNLGTVLDGDYFVIPITVLVTLILDEALQHELQYDDLKRHRRGDRIGHRRRDRRDRSRFSQKSRSGRAALGRGLSRGIGRDHPSPSGWLHPYPGGRVSTARISCRNRRRFFSCACAHDGRLRSSPSLVLAVTVTPSLAAFGPFGSASPGPGRPAAGSRTPGPCPTAVDHAGVWDRSVRGASLLTAGLVALGCAVIAVFGYLVYLRLETDFLPSFDEEGGLSSTSTLLRAPA